MNSCNFSSSKITSSFNTHHSAFGAFSSFILGKFGQGGGFILNDVKSPNGNIYIGYKNSQDGMRVMPFCNLESYDFGQQFGFENKDDGQWVKQVKIINEDEITRELSIASDSWNCGNFTFKIYTPLDIVPDIEVCNKEEFKKYCAPSILIDITMDNTNEDNEALVFFGMDSMGRLIGDHSNEMNGGAMARTYGFAAYKNESIEDIGFNSLRFISKNAKANYRLGNEVILSAKVKPGEKKTLTIALATYQDGYVTSGLNYKFAYTEYFRSLEEVLLFTLNNQEYIRKTCEKRDSELAKAQLNTWRQMLLSQAVHSYYASSELLIGEDKAPLWVVNEGQYRMMNTLDLTVDHLFFELSYHPWTIKNTMDFFKDNYSYKMDIKTQNGQLKQGGISFAHDCGVANMFSKLGTSAYEFVYEDGCFSYMTMEELLNWSICSSIYGVGQKDKNWLLKQKETLIECYNSIVLRDSNSDGVMDSDCVGCGSAYEITTYDSIDKSLSHAGNNLYMAVKTFGAILCLKQVFELIDEKDYANKCEAFASRTASTVCSNYNETLGYIPSMFDGQMDSQIIPAIEGLIYPWIIGDTDAVEVTGRFGDLIQRLKQHFNTIMVPGACIEKNSLGWRLSSSSVNTWMSKIYLSQFISETILGFENNSALADKAHAIWQFEGCGELCAVDQVNCENGTAIGSRLYPRLVTSILWQCYGKKDKAH